MAAVRSIRSQRRSSRHVAPSIRLFLGLYTLLLLVFAPQATGLALNPISMTYSNKAQEYTVGTVALVCCIVSLLASLMCMYWFCRMEKRFRHRLIMILIYGDLMRGTWLFIFAIISLARGTVQTSSTFCQASGFLVQYGTQTSDYGVFIMALHSAIQVFYPSTLVSSDGLYPHRRYIYIGAFVLPILMAGLAFVNPSWAYVSQGAFCTLPVRPFWYRLALTWVPRYIIVLMIIGLAVAIYAHVGFEFRAYSNIDQSLQSYKTSDSSTTPPQDENQNDTKMGDITLELITMERRPQPQRRHSSIGHDIFTSQRQASPAPALSPAITHKVRRVSFDSDRITQCLPGGALKLNRDRPDTTRPVLIAIPSGYSITVPVSPLARSPPPRTQDSSPNRPNNPKSIATSSSSSSTRALSPSAPAQTRLAKQRQRIHRQLRLMFIYPLVYTLMWLLPFVMHCMNYSDKWAANPVEFLRIGSSISITLMGLTDALIFSLREKPWRGTEGGDGSFWGSFTCWRSYGGDKEDDTATGESERRSGAWGRGSASYRTSASGEFAWVAAEQARVRLGLEREERLAELESRQGSWLKMEGIIEEDHEGKADKYGDREHEDKEDHNGLDFGDGRDGQVYDDNGLEDDTI